MAISAYDKLDYATYTPRTTQEIWAPLQYMRENHDKLQEEYSQQEQQGGLSLLGIDPVKDKAAYDIQQNYIQKTKDAADQLATKGFIDSGRRRGLMEVKSLYTNQVVPLENQLKIRQQRAEEYRRQAMDRNWIGGRNPNEVSLTEGLKNPEAFNYQGVNANQMAETLGNKMTPYAQQLLSTGAIKKHQHPYAYQAILSITQGVDPNVVMAAMQNNPEALKDPAAKRLYNDMQVMLDQTLQEYKFSDIAPVGSEAYNRGRMITARGFSKGIGNVSIQGAQDQYGMQIAAEKREATRRRAEEKANQPQILGNDINIPIFDEGYTPQNIPALLRGKPAFNADGSINTSVNARGFYRPKGKTLLEQMIEKDQYATKKLIDVYRKENYTKMNLKGKTDFGVFKIMQQDPDGALTSAFKKQHTLSPIVDTKVGEQILNTAFSNIPALQFVDYNSNYKADSNSGIDYTTMAKRSGFTNGQQLLDYMKKHPELMSVNRTDGRFSIQIPTNVTGVDKNGDLSFDGNKPEYKYVGFSASNTHKNNVSAISKLRSRQSERQKDVAEVSRETVYDNGKQLTVISYHDGKNNQIYQRAYDTNGNLVDEDLISPDSFIGNANANIYYGEIEKAYFTSRQK